MKINILFTSLLFISFSVSSFSWGDKGHQLIMQKALLNLPEELAYLNNWKEYLNKQVLDADNRKEFDKSEDPKHYIDMDFYEEFLKGEMIFSKEVLANKYGNEKVVEIGLLPWATIETFENLTIAFTQKDRDRILMLIADLAHYVGDGHQPLHTVLNYDGQLSGQKGLHFRYEIDMINKYIGELDSLVAPPYSGLVYNPSAYIFDYISDSNFKNDILISSDKIASAGAELRSEDYYRILWFRTRNLTVEQLNKAASSLSALIYTAWNNAGKPSLTEIN